MPTPENVALTQITSASRGTSGGGGNFAVFNGRQSPEVIAAGKAAVAAERTAASVITATLEEFGSLNAQQQSSIDRVAADEKAAELGKQERAQLLLEQNRKALAAGGVDLSDPNNLIAQNSAKVTQLSQQRQAVGDKLTAAAAIDPLSDPFGYLMAQFTTGGLVDQYNNLAIQENGIMADSASIQTAAADYNKLLTSTLPAHTLEENNLALTKIEETAAQEKLKNQIALGNTRNQAAINMGELTSRQFSIMSTMDSQRLNLEQAHISSMNAAIANREASFEKLYTKSKIEKAMVADNLMRNMEAAMGLEAGSGENMLHTMNAADRERVLRFAYSNQIDSPETAAIIARYVVPGRAIPNIAKMARMITDANTTVASMVADGSIEQKLGSSGKNWKTMADADKSLEVSAQIRTLVSAKLGEQARILHPSEAADIGISIKREFPELVGLLDPKIQTTPLLELETFKQQSGGNTAKAAARMAEYTRAKLGKVAENSTLQQTGMAMPSAVNTVEQVAGKFYGTNPQNVNWADPSSIENFLLRRGNAVPHVSGTTAGFVR